VFDFSFLSLLVSSDGKIELFSCLVFLEWPWEELVIVENQIFSSQSFQTIEKSVLAHFHTYYISLAIALWIGFNKGLRTVFMALCIPSHVPLDRLPSATGLHLLFSAIFYIFMGPVVGN
jgi:hypothetical protein